MFSKLKTLVTSRKKDQNIIGQVKTNTQTTDNIISRAVSNAGNISQITLSKEEQSALIKKRKSTPFYIILLKYVSTIVFSILLALMIFFKVDTHPENAYLKNIAVQNNAGSKHKIIKSQYIEKTTLDSSLKKEIEDKKQRLKEKQYSEFTDQVEVIQIDRKQLFNKIQTNTDLETGETETFISYGLLDSFESMIDYFKDVGFQMQYFAKRDRELLGTTWEVCKNPLTPIAKKKQANCPILVNIIMRNDIEIQSINISDQGVSVSIDVREILSKVFTLGSEFVDMMNSFSFLKNGSIQSFTRKQLPNGEDSMGLNIKFEFQDKKESDSMDIYFKSYTNWEKIQNSISSALQKVKNTSSGDGSKPVPRKKTAAPK